MSPKHAYWVGIRAAVPVILGTVPVGLAFAVMARQAGLTMAETCGMSLLVCAGASQMMAVGMFAQGAGLAAIVIATFVLNLRHLIMSTCVMHPLRNEKTGRKLLAAFGVTDETFAFFSLEKTERANAYYMMGLITVAYSSWVGGTAIGAFLGGLLPAVVSDSLGIALYALFIALIVPDVKGSLRLFGVVVFTALVNYLLSLWLPSSWAIIVATLVGALVGVFCVRDRDLGMVEEPLPVAKGGEAR